MQRLIKRYLYPINFSLSGHSIITCVPKEIVQEPRELNYFSKSLAKDWQSSFNKPKYQNDKLRLKINKNGLEIPTK